jgi:outer membrane immunogenic protein
VGEFDWTHLNASSQATVLSDPSYSSASASENIDWLASVRGRLGWAFDNILFYATGGVAWTKIKDNVSLSFPDYPTYDFAAQGSSNKTGVVGGLGFEHRLTQNVSVAAELLWYGFGSTSITATGSEYGPVVTQFNNNDILVGTLGANWHL